MADTEPQLDKSTKTLDLRQFRLKKKIIMPSSKTELIPGKKRIQMMATDNSSDSDDNQTAKKFKMEVLSVKEKEARFLHTTQVAPEYDTMDIQNALVRSEWNVEKAQEYLKANCKVKPSCRITAYAASSSSKYQEQKPISNGSTTKKRSKTNSRYTDGDDSSDDEVKQTTDQVYDSDDSDAEASNEMTSQRSNVFDFMNKATLSELLTVKSLSEKKANFILELRPFNNWTDLCNKLESNKSLSADLLNNAQELINKQNNVKNILKKCNALIKRLEASIETGAGIVDQPKLLNNQMKLADYQIIGLNWLTVMHNQKMNGILADEMGLGKTIQIIAFLAYLKENQLNKGAHLIVVPSSTLDNWENEIHKWCPSLKVEKYYGSQDERRRMRIRYAKEGFHSFDVVLTTYNIVSSSPEERKMFRVCRLHYVIFDEAHMLKNMASQRYANLMTINAEMRILLTGTPLQNNIMELMSLLCFVMPAFFAKSIHNIKSLFAKKLTTENASEDSSPFEKTQVQRAKRIMKPFVLRRLKNDVLKNLPKKTSYTIKVPMSEKQKIYYHELVDYYSNNKGEICSGERAGISIMMEMRKVANHPLLVRHYFSDSYLTEISKRLAKLPTYKKTNPDYIFEELAIMSDFQVWQLCHKYQLDDVQIPDELICDSGKFKHLDELLPKLKAEGHRVLIFSQFTMMLDIVESYLSIRNVEYYRLDGSTAVDERQDLITDFNEDSGVFVFLLSTKAGGVGINLTAADTCIIHDVDFNPYNDKQAEDRCHRLGQTRPVTIYKMISESTIEEGMALVAAQKLKLEQEITETENGEQAQETKCVVRLLTMALGLDKEEEKKLNSSINSSFNSPTK